MLVSLYHVEYAVELANALAEFDHVHLILKEDRVENTIGQKSFHLLSLNVSWTLLPIRSLKHPSTLYSLLIIIRKFKKLKPDIVHIQECNNILNLFFLILGFKKNVVTVHDVVLHPGSEVSSNKRWKLMFINLLRRYVYQNIIVHGEKLKKLLLKHYRNQADNVFVIPHGSLCSFRVKGQVSINEEPFTVLFFGRIQEYKGLKYLIQAEPIVSKELPEFKIIIAGQGQDLDALKPNLMENRHLEVHDRFIPNDEVSIFFQRTVVVVLPYIEASQSGVVAMAFAFGKPVIVTQVGSIAEMVEHNVSGIIIPPKNSKALAKAIIDILKSPEKRKVMSQNALMASKTRFNWRHITTLTKNVYSCALSKKSYNETDILCR